MSVIRVDIDDTLMKEANELFASLGITMEEAIRMFLKEAIRRGDIPFELPPSERLQEAIDELKDMETHPEEYKSYSSTKELIKDLNM